MFGKTKILVWDAKALFTVILLVIVGAFPGIIVPQAEAQTESRADGPDKAAARQLYDEIGQLYARGQRAEAIPLAERLVDLMRRLYGEGHPNFTVALNLLAGGLADANRGAEAESLYRRGIEINEAALGPDHPDVARDLNNLASLLEDLNRPAEAEPLLRRVVGVMEKAGPGHRAELAAALNNLAHLLISQDQRKDAEALLRRVVELLEKAGGESQPNFAVALNNLAAFLQDEKRSGEAEAMYRRALAALEKSLGASHPSVAGVLNNIAVLLQDSKRFEDAEKNLRRAVAIMELRLGPDHRDVAPNINNLAQLLEETGRFAEAESLMRRALAIDEANFSADHSRLAIRRTNLAWLAAEQNDWSGALEHMRRAAAIRTANAAQMRAAGGERRLLAQHANAFKGLALMAFRAAPTDGAVRDEAFVASQRALLTSAADALARASERFVAGSGALAALVREKQDLAALREASGGALTAALGSGDGDAAERARKELAALDARSAQIGVRLAAEFPDYVALEHPEPVSIAEVQALLQPDEVFVQFLDLPGFSFERIPETGFAWAISRTDARWVELPLGKDGLTRRVVQLRCGLSSSVWGGEKRASSCETLLNVQAPVAGEPLPFDLGIAHELYQALFGQIEDLIEGKRLLIVPSGPLGAIPFQVLPTQRPVPGAHQAGWESYRGVSWLGRRQAVTFVPSARGWATLRRSAKPSGAAEPFIGFGDPAVKGNEDCGAIAIPERCPGEGETSAAAPAQGFKSYVAAAMDKYFRGGVADVNKVRRLCPLPDTAHELKCVARSLNAPKESVLTGAAASETAVKTAPLDRYRVVHFATHGLLSSESAGLGAAGGRAEPALVLTPPDAATEADDGLLTVSEIARLRLDADWVVLSACNTAAGASNDAEALSGLAQAFFYAGARRVLASYWPVDSNSATTLTSQIFRELKDAPDVGAAEALRRSERALMDDRAQPWSSHPSFWAPFVVVGGG